VFEGLAYSDIVCAQSALGKNNVNAAGVIPVIFAMAFFLLPRTLTLFFPKADWAQTISTLFLQVISHFFRINLNKGIEIRKCNN
jgi:preprotein translocase subunit SecY